MISAFSVIVPVRNEAVQLAKTAPALKKALKGLPGEAIYVLNATQDNSAEIITQTFGAKVRLIELATSGKTAALRAGDAASRHSLRVYLDADITISPDIFQELLAPLMRGQADLVAPRIMVDLDALSGLALRVGRVWADQLERRPDAFLACTAMNEAGLRSRGIWPDLLADDDWARNQISPDRRLIVTQTWIKISPPRDLLNWLKVRARWIQGSKQLRKLDPQTPSPQRVPPHGTLPDLLTYYTVRVLAQLLAYFQQWVGVDWNRDNSTRT